MHHHQQSLLANESSTRSLEKMGFGSALFVWSLPPAIIAFILAMASSIALNIADYSICADNLQNYLIGSIALGYLFVLFYGILLLGPIVESLSLLITLLMLFAGFSLAWTVYGCIALSNSIAPCSGGHFWNMSLAVVILHMIMLSSFVIATLVRLSVSCCCEAPVPSDDMYQQHNRSNDNQWNGNGGTGGGNTNNGGTFVAAEEKRPSTINANNNGGNNGNNGNGGNPNNNNNNNNGNNGNNGGNGNGNDVSPLPLTPTGGSNNYNNNNNNNGNNGNNTNNNNNPSSSSNNNNNGGMAGMSSNNGNNGNNNNNGSGYNGSMHGNEVKEEAKMPSSSSTTAAAISAPPPPAAASGPTIINSFHDHPTADFEL